MACPVPLTKRRNRPADFLLPRSSAAAARAKLLNLLNGITDLHFKNTLAEHSGCFGWVAVMALPISGPSGSHLVESQH